MTRLKRLLWLLAWGGWLLAGVGLYQQLPRGYGPRVSRLRLAEGVRVLGFVGDTNAVALLPPAGELDRLPHLALFDAETGQALGERPAPLAAGVYAQTHDPYFHRFRETLRHGVLCGTRAGEPPPQRFHAYDVMKNAWLPLTERPVMSHYRLVHPNRPWLSTVGGTSRRREERVEVFDLNTGEALFSRDLPVGTTLADRPLFLADRDAIALPLAASQAKQAGAGRMTLEVWKIAAPPVLDAAVEILTGDYSTLSVSGSGRLAFNGAVTNGTGDEAWWADLYDFKERRFLSSVPPSEQRRGGAVIRRVASSTALAPSGRAVMRFGPEQIQEPDSTRMTTRVLAGTLYEVGTGRIMWAVGPTEMVTGTLGDEAFLVAERWDQHWGRWFSGLKYETVAVRSLEDGRFLYRLTSATKIDPRDCNASRTLVVLADGSVHRLPPQPSWSLFAFLQAFLALPLVLLWAGLRWRRRRRARGAAVG